VAEDVETLSGHLYILMEVDLEETNTRGRGASSRPKAPPRWRVKGRDKQMLRAGAIVSAWNWDAREETSLGSVDEEAEDL
jgi:hypothetical protein